MIDTRNTYEIEIGTLENAIDPRTENFSEFPDYLEKLAEDYDWNSRGNSISNNGDGCADGLCDNETRNNDAKRMKNDSDTTAETKVIQQNETNKQKKKPPPKGIAMVCTGARRPHPLPSNRSYSLMYQFIIWRVGYWHISMMYPSEEIQTEVIQIRRRMGRMMIYGRSNKF